MIPPIPGYSEEAWKDFTFNTARLQKMQDGARIILDFLQLVFSQGLLSSELLSEDNLKELSIRLVDTQIPSAARKIKSFSRWELNPETLPLFRFEFRFLGNLAGMLLDFDNLTISAKLHVWQICGGIIGKELVLGQPGLVDLWEVKSSVITREDSLVSRKTWYYGKNSMAWVYTLDYSFGTQPLPEGRKTGEKFAATVKFYPGLLPGRVLIVEQADKTKANVSWTPMQFTDIAGLQNGMATMAAYDPLFREFPILMSEVIVAYNQGQFYLIDQKNLFLSLRTIEKGAFGSEETALRRFADAGGYPVHLWTMISEGGLILM